MPLDKDELVLGLLAAPGLPTEIAEELAADLPPLLAERVTDAVSWRVPVLTEPEATHLTSGVDAIDLGRERMLRHGWDLAVCVTDAPLRMGRRPIVADASATHGVALISLPALGAMQTRRRARDAVIRLVDGLVGESLETGHGVAARRVRVGRRLAELAAPIRAVEAPDVDDVDLRFVAAVARGNLRLLTGMIRANRPWRLIARLSRALAAAAVGGGAGARDLRPLEALGCARLDSPARAHGAVGRRDGALADRVAPPVGATRGRASREQTVLFNLATTLTLLLGAAFLYAALFAMTLLGAALVIDSGVMAQALGHDAGIGDYVALAWMASSLGTLAGGLGAGLESDEAVREAAYGYRAERTSERESRVPERA